ncbi:MAG: hypothetical protein ACFFED_15900 [Candidatus Thorarchaeota archaeon]
MNHKKILATTGFLVFLLVLGSYPVAQVFSLGISHNATFLPAADSDYCTLIGGDAQEDATKITFDNSGSVILIGQTQSSDFPATDGALQEIFGGGDWDAFVAKFSESGDLLWATYLGGSGYEHVTSVNCDAANNILLSGTTGSPNFHISEDAYQSTIAGSFDGFITKLAPNGTLLYSSFIGGTGEDWIYGIEQDAEGNYLFGGWTTSGGLATTGAYKETISNADIFAGRLSSDGRDIEMFSYLGGSSPDRGWAMTVDAEYNYVLSGITESSDLPTTSNAFQSEYGGSVDSYLAVLAYNGSTLLYLTYVGGSDEDMGLVDVDSNGNYLLAGPTKSDDISVVNAFQDEYAGGLYDSYVAKFAPNGEVVFLSYLGGNRTDRTWDVRATPDDTIVMVGRTNSDDFPTMNARQLTRAGDYDAYATEISEDGSEILRSGLVGGSNEDIGEGIAIDTDGSIVISGRASSANFPTTDGAYQEDYAGGRDVFVCHNIFDVQTTSGTDTTPTENQPPLDGIDILPVLIVISISLAVIVIIVLKLRK